jgi:hypothetical protein
MPGCEKTEVGWDGRLGHGFERGELLAAIGLRTGELRFWVADIFGWFTLQGWSGYLDVQCVLSTLRC